MTISSRFQRIAFGFTLVCLYALVGCSKPIEAPVPIRAVRTLVVSETGGSVEREFAADIRARTESRLGFRVAGKVSRRLVSLGDAVRVGQVLGQLDPNDLRLGQEAARAGLAAAEANVVQAAADLQRFTELRAQGFVSQAELDRHVTASKMAEASLRQSRAQVGVQSNQMSYAALAADASGVVTAIDMEPGQVVNAGLPVVTLAQDGPRDVVFSVPEDIFQQVKSLRGRSGGVKVRRWGTTEWTPATVREVSAAADPLTRTYLVKADVGGRAGFELGQTASVLLMTSSIHASGGVRVPLQAVFERDGHSAVWVLNSATMVVQAMPIVAGDVSGNMLVVTQGITPGQELVTAGVHVLTPGQKVKRYQAQAPNAPSAASAAVAL